MTTGSVTVQCMYTLTVLGNVNRECYCSGYVYIDSIGKLTAGSVSVKGMYTLTVLGN